MSITLTDDQQAAYNAFVEFIYTPEAKEFSISGFAGTGKSTLVTAIRQNLTAILKHYRMVTGKEIELGTQLTATTNKAANALAKVTQDEVLTIHSFLGLILKTDYKNHTQSLVTTSRSEIKTGYLVFIDEASYIDEQLLGYIRKYLGQCKVVYIGDPAQLAPIKSPHTPVYTQNIPEARLTQVVRQDAGSSIIDLATAFRNTVYGQGWIENYVPDGTSVKYLSRDDFESEMIKEFDRSDWHYDSSKLLAYTNKTVQHYNHFVRKHVAGEAELEVGDYAIVNSAVISRSVKLKTDQLVEITYKEKDKSLGVPGWRMTLDGKQILFMPESLDVKKLRIKEAKAKNDGAALNQIDTQWVDLRAAYACTINKAQGSTYKRVFIDLDDVRRCTNPKTLARLMYVAVSRASNQVILTGDLVASDKKAA